MDKTKIYALYLPQFYETDYNDDWWGKGYTEWTACKAAKPIFKNHYQPKIPYNNHFYDLSNKEEIKKQATLAKQYGIDGFIIYQYYSCNNSKYGDTNGKNGRMLLNKPTEIIRDNHDIDIPYCLCWANHPWLKSWFGNDSRMLWDQKYGNKDDWKDFFEYNLQYFKDKRYIRIDNKPVYFIYAPWRFDKVQQFIEYWNILAKENGLEGIYFIRTESRHTSVKSDGFDAFFRREPFYTLSKGAPKYAILFRGIRVKLCRMLNRILGKINKGIVSFKCSYDTFYKQIIKYDDYSKTIIPGICPGWDNTARKQYDAQILVGATPQKFEKCLSILLEKCKKNDVPFIVINAWNEWAEGAYLEADTKNGYAYLEAIKNCKDNC